MTAGKASKATILVDEKYNVWLGNLTDANLQLHAGELLGFGAGSFKELVVSDTPACNSFSQKSNFEKF